MYSKIHRIVLGLVLVAALVLSAGSFAVANNNVGADEPPEGCPECGQDTRYPIMQPDKETIARWIASYEAAPKYEIEAGELFTSMTAAPTSSSSVLGHLDYDTSDRDQHSCGNCWQWAGTGAMEIAHDVENGVFDRLSIQYLNSNYANACCGGWLEDVADFYDNAFAIPWSNPNASWQDGITSCGGGTTIAPGTITTTPRYDILNAQEYTIETHTGETAAIANIKSVLDSEQGIFFAFYLPNFNPFFGFWDDDGSAAVWDFDPYDGEDYSAGINPGGHAVLCVGYNDDPGTDNDYWIMLNSWGDAGGARTDGLFRVEMHMNYDATLANLNSGYGSYIHYWQMLDIDFNAPQVDAGSNQHVDEGDTVSFSGTYTWPGISPASPNIDWDFGDGYTDSGSLTTTHVYCDNGVYTVTLVVSDDSGHWGQDTLRVTADNVAPTAGAGTDQSVDEGDTVNFSGSFTDPGTCDTHTIAWNFGDGGTDSGTLTPTHVYGDNGIFIVTLTVTDDDGEVGTDNLTVTVNNVAPTIEADSMTPPNSQFILPIVHTLDFEARATDPGSDDLTFTWDWGDPISDTAIYYNNGVSSDPYPSPDVNPMDVTDTADHVYSAPGDYTVTLTVTDDDGGVDTATQSVHVADIEEAKHITNQYIQDLADTAFKGKASNRKAALDNMFAALDYMLATENYNGMIQHLRNNIREKADGQVDGKPNNDWITDTDAQTEICQKIDDMTAYLETFL